ncbi:uncharacterized protein VTP21DRAFT_11704 [Calcarisporiella thermophila]|uniref:uncharacterized protein n=1 Tax=Calcarisporiella thermophila TaxID=911321 RepID=UPI0037447559
MINAIDNLITKGLDTLHNARLPTKEEFDALRDRLASAGQAHLLTFWDTLSDSEKRALFHQLSELDVERCNRIFQLAIEGAERASTSGKCNLEPLPASVFDSVLEASSEQIDEWKRLGLELIARGEVGVILMAGGQGTRLGSSAPKGCYDINLPSKKSLFQIQAERIRRLQVLAASHGGVEESSVVIPWYVMTSGPTREATEKFFKHHNYFGLNAQNVLFFDQGTLPCFSMDGKILLETKSQLTAAPDGNGGVYEALRKHKILDSMDSRGVKYLHAYCVDNCLVRVADPVFVGYCVSKGADCGAKTVPKSCPTEPVGVVCLRNGKFGVVEYSEIDAEIAARTKPNGQLAFGAANIANHFYTLDFLRRIKDFESQLEYHVAKKKVKCVDVSSGNQLNPTTPNALKMEMFVFDVFPFTERMAVLEVERQDEFSPLKNAPGSNVDCPETSRRDILQQHLRFVNKAGATVEGDGDLEISPLVTYSGEGLSQLHGKTIKTPAIINDVEDLKKF